MVQAGPLKMNVRRGYHRQEHKEKEEGRMGSNEDM